MRLWVLLLPLCALAQDRVAEAKARRSAEIHTMLAAVGLSDAPAELHLRAFKKERVLEVWGAAKRGDPMVLIKQYSFCAASGDLGPKRKEGDLQVPEGFYVVPEFNPTSSYHLSMKVSYPNASDKVRSDQRRPGGLIYLHGSCASIGCIAIEDGPIEEVYLIARATRRQPVTFDIFPFRMSADALASVADSPHAPFWLELKAGFEAFEATHRPSRPRIDKTGVYRF
jgi:murein L,D-transpeptidase YafK